MMRRFVLAASLAAVALAAPAQADYRDGWEAFEKGDFRGAMRAWVPLAEWGEAQAQYAMGILLLYGRGIDADPAGAAILLAPAAAAELPEAAYALATLYQDGRGVKRDVNEAMRLYGVAALAGHAQAQNNLGIMLALAEGNARNAASAHTWLAIAARNGEAGAARNRDRIAVELTPAELAESERATNAFRTARPQVASLPLNPADTYPGAENLLKRIEAFVRPPGAGAAQLLPKLVTPGPADTAANRPAAPAPIGLPAIPPVTAPVPAVAVEPAQPLAAATAPLPILPPRP